MRIRLSVLFIGLLGMAAAVAAAMLTASLQARPMAEARKLIAPDATILVAARELPAMTILDQSMIEERTVPGSQAPEGALADKTQAIGKLLTVPVVPQQALTQNLFAAEGSGLHVSAMLPDGMRAVSVALSDYCGLEGLLYPGSRVDVLGAFPIKGANKEGSAVSTALLENVQVLAVGRQAVGLPEDDKEQGAANSSNKFNHKIMVTLMVDGDQAEALQLAMEHGQISLALRNPSDVQLGDQDATLLSEGRLAQLARLLDPTVSSDGVGQEAAPGPAHALAAAVAPAAVEASEAAAEKVEAAVEPAAAPPGPRRARQEEPQVKINVIRGVATETVSFPYPQSMR